MYALVVALGQEGDAVSFAAVVLDGVDFSYDGKKEVLHDVSLYAKPG